MKRGSTKNRVWYAVQNEPEDAWDYGSYSYHEALEMLKNQGHGLIAAIDTQTNFCLDQIFYDSL